jgi:hypothetical protein
MNGWRRGGGSSGALGPVDAPAGGEDRVGRSESTRSIWIDIDGDFSWDPHVSHVQDNRNDVGGRNRWLFRRKGKTEHGKQLRVKMSKWAELRGGM